MVQNKLDKNALAPLSRVVPAVEAAPNLGIMNRTALVMGRLEAELCTSCALGTSKELSARLTAGRICADMVTRGPK